MHRDGALGPHLPRCYAVAAISEDVTLSSMSVLLSKECLHMTTLSYRKEIEEA